MLTKKTYICGTTKTKNQDKKFTRFVEIRRTLMNPLTFDVSLN